MCAPSRTYPGGLVADSRRNFKSQDPLRVLREHLALGVTGCLTLRDKDGAELRVYVMQGEVLASHGAEDSRLVVRRLVNHGALTETQAARIGHRLDAGERLDDLLVELVPDDLLLDVMAARFRQCLLEFLSVAALPTFEPMDAVFVDNIQVGHNTAALLGELEGRRDRVRGLRAHASAVTVRAGRGRPRSLEEARLLDLCEQPVRVSELAARSPLEQGETLDLVHGMIGTGVLLAEGLFPGDDEEPTELSQLDQQPGDEPDTGIQELDVWPEAAPIEPGLPAHVDEHTAHVEVESDEEDENTVQDQEEASPAPQPLPVPATAADEDEARIAAERSFRAEMERELRQQSSQDEEGWKPVVPPGFDFFAVDGVDESEVLFVDHDREVGRGGGEGTYTSAIKDVVDLGPRRPPPPSEDDGLIEAESLESLPESERVGVRSLSFGAPPLEEDEARNAFEIVNNALREIARALDEQNGPGAGRAFVQLLVEGTPAEFSSLFRAVDARKDGRLPVDNVLRNLRERPRTEHRQLVHRGLEDLIERALTLSCEELDDAAADALTERVLAFQRQLNL